MKLTCLVDNLKSAIAIASRITPTNALLPSLNGILLKAENGVLKITATNLETTVKLEINCHVETEGVVCIQGKIFNEICQTLSAGQITLESDSKTLNLTADKFKTKLNILPATDFPTLPEIVPSVTFACSSTIAKQMIDRVVFASSLSDTQPEISSVLFRSNADGFFSVATDRYRLAKFWALKEQVVNWDDVLVPLRVAQEAGRFLAGLEEEVEISYGEQQIWWKTSAGVLIGRVVEGQYPAFEQILLSSYTTSIKVNRNDFLQAVKTIGVFVRTKGYVRLTHKGDKLDVSAENGDNGEGSVVVDAEIQGQEGSLLFGFKYLAEGINSISDEEIKIQQDESSSAVGLCGVKSDDYRYVVMPIRI